MGEREKETERESRAGGWRSPVESIVSSVVGHVTESIGEGRQEQPPVCAHSER